MKKLLFILMAAMLLVACGDSEYKEYEKQRKEAEKNLKESEMELERLEGISEKIDETGESLKELQKQMGITEEDADYIGDLNQDEIKELFDFHALGSDDVLINLVIDDDEIQATVEVADHKKIDNKNILAESIYSGAGDLFLQYEGWDVLTIEFEDIGKVSMHREEKETNEYGMDYFPLEKIIEQLE